MIVIHLLHLLLIYFLLSLLSKPTHAYDCLGCWKGTDEVSKIPPDEDDLKSTFGPIYQGFPINYPNISVKCAQIAQKKSFRVFAVLDHECRADSHTELTYRKYGSSKGCKDGRGTNTSAQVYSLAGTYGLEYLSDQDDAVVTKKAEDFHPNDVDTLPGEIGSPSSSREVTVTGTRKDTVLMTRVFNALYGNSFDSSLPMQLPSYPPDHRMFPHPGIFNAVVQHPYMEYLQSHQRSSPLSGNVFNNPGFEAETYQFSPYKEWNCQGELNDHRAGIMKRTMEYKKRGNFGGICTNRVAEWAGPGQYVGNRLKPGHAYKVHGWTKLLNTEDRDELASIELWIRFQGNDIKNQSETRILLGKRDKYIPNQGWQEWNSQFYLPAHHTGFRYVFIYFKGPRPGIDIALDEMQLKELGLHPDWLKEANEKIEEIRKRDVTVRLKFDTDAITAKQLSSIRVKVTQKRNDFGFGAAIGHKALEESKQYRDYFLENFEWGVPENAMKWDMVEAKRGEKRYENMEKILKILNDSDIKIRGHCIFWEQESQLPKWVGDLSNRELTKALEDRLEDIMDKYAGKFEHWDVNNEMLHGSTFSDKLAVGTWVREWMYKRAHERDPKAKLFVNDFDVVANGIFTQSFWELIRGFLEKKIPIHAIGVQGHFFGWTHPRILQERLDILSQAKLPIWITEMDILEHDERKRARALEHIMRTAFSHPSVDGIVLWAFWSKAAWRGRDTALINDDFSERIVNETIDYLHRQSMTEAQDKQERIVNETIDYLHRQSMTEAQDKINLF